MGVVYRAHDPLIGRTVAIKVLYASRGEDRDSNEQRSRFEQEFRSAGTLSHPNLVTIYDVGDEEGVAYIAMECVEGSSLDAVLRAGRELSFTQIADTALELCSGLDFAHAAGVIHRDIKPANILLTPEGRPKITDFGVAKVLSSNLTQTGTVVGTPSYMAPEQITSQGITGASDQFALGVILYQMLTGQLPFRGDIPTTILYKIVHEAPTPPHQLNPDLPPAVDQALLRALAKNPADRFATCVALGEALREALGVTPPLTEDSTQGTVTLTGESLPAGSGTYDGARSWWRSRRGGTRFGLAVATLLVGAVAVAAAGAYLGFIPALEPFWDRIQSPRTTTVAAADPGADPGADSGNLAKATAPAIDLPKPAADEPKVAPAPEPEPTQPPPVVATFTIDSRPQGATVRVDGKRLAAPTPTEVELTFGHRYDIAVAKDGFSSAGSDKLEPSSRGDQRRLFYELEPVIPPGTLGIESAYPVTVSVDGKRVTGSPLSLAPGSHDVEIAAPSVFYRLSQTVEIKSGQLQTIRLPEAVSVFVTSVPSGAELTIDGTHSFVAPQPLQFALGANHRFHFRWPDGKYNERTQAIGVTVRRITGSATEIKVN